MQKLTTVYERVSKSGRRYLAGRLGELTMLIFEDREPSADGQKTFSVMLAQRGDAAQRDDANREPNQ